VPSSPIACLVQITTCHALSWTSRVRRTSDRAAVTRLPGAGPARDAGDVRSGAGEAARPPRRALDAFGVTGRPIPLHGGRGTSWRVGDAVLKPLDMAPTMLAWQAALLGRLAGQAGFRVSVPLAARDGSWTVAGWTAWRYESGRHQARRWAEIIAAGDRLHAALADEPRPPWLDERTDGWAVGDRVAWGEVPAAEYAAAKHVTALSEALRPIDGRAQLIHGDLTGNVLFEDGLAPLLIDLSPYWRPPAFAAAIVIADALAFEHAGPQVLEPVLEDPDFGQYLLRALIYRAVAARLLRPASARATDDDPYEDAVRLALELTR
jgi:uncharacterized protein (TIGR02569 family)